MLIDAHSHSSSSLTQLANHLEEVKFHTPSKRSNYNESPRAMA